MHMFGQRFGQKLWAHWSENYRLGVWNGWFILTGEGFLNPSVVLSAFASKLGAPSAVIGLLPALVQGGWMLPQVIVAAIIQSQPYKLPYYKAAATIRTASYLWMVLSSALLIQHPTWLLLSFILGLLVNSVASGVSGLPFLEVVSKTVPAQQRTAFFATRNLYGGLLAFLAGLLISWILSLDIPFPYNYTIIFTLGTLSYTIGYAIFGKIQEPADAPQQSLLFIEELKQLPILLSKDAHLRNYILVRIIWSFAAMAEAFYAVYALKSLQVPIAMLGVFLMGLAGISPLSNIFWRKIGQTHGSRRILRLSSSIACLSPLLALVLPKHLFLLVFIISAIANQGFNLGNLGYSLNIAPEHARSRYLGIINTIVGIALFAPVLGGFLVDAFGYPLVFMLSSLLFLVGYLAASLLRRDT